ncbi:unnamed protein product [Cylicocyclus nassatus]|uniref:Uncharacterized protein n=1 Tax=Cylicocyclus nassatus TaxID=53992 RepID=A0AA36H3B4_CYLNA|nr:unnamed protein product [Cylicocyclus nassatus]
MAAWSLIDFSQNWILMLPFDNLTSKADDPGYMPPEERRAFQRRWFILSLFPILIRRQALHCHLAVIHRRVYRVVWVKDYRDHRICRVAISEEVYRHNSIGSTKGLVDPLYGPKDEVPRGHS